MKKSLQGLFLSTLLLTAGSAIAADYKIDKEGQHAFVNFRIQHLGYSWLGLRLVCLSLTYLSGMVAP